MRDWEPSCVRDVSQHKARRGGKGSSRSESARRHGSRPLAISVLGLHVTKPDGRRSFLVGFLIQYVPCFPTWYVVWFCRLPGGKGRYEKRRRAISRLSVASHSRPALFSRPCARTHARTMGAAGGSAWREQPWEPGRGEWDATCVGCPACIAASSSGSLQCVPGCRARGCSTDDD